jgi:hypothetical protein
MFWHSDSSMFFIKKKQLSMKTDEETGQTLPKNADKI